MLYIYEHLLAASYFLAYVPPSQTIQFFYFYCKRVQIADVADLSDTIACMAAVRTIYTYVRSKLVRTSVFVARKRAQPVPSHTTS